MADRREMLEAAMNEAMEPEVEEQEVQEPEPEVEAEPARNEKGQFVSKEEAPAEEQEEAPEVEASAILVTHWCMPLVTVPAALTIPTMPVTTVVHAVADQAL